MKVSYNWLKDYVSFDQSPEQVAEILTLTGLEVEEIHKVGSDLTGVVVGRVTACDQHPNADRLKLCRVDVGEAEPLQIVCGAPNVDVDQKVLVATIGTELPVSLPDGSPLVIRKSKIRGEVSLGMICAEDELGLGDDHAGIMVLNPEAEVGASASSVVNTNIDFIFEIGLTPNRPDASCHLGVARDLAAVLNKHLKKPFKTLSNPDNAVTDHPDISITIADTDKCHRYVGILVTDVKVGPSPDWLSSRLKSIGLRPINNIVDATNYVLHELGQPLHAFDYNLVSEKKIEVKAFDKERSFITLDEVERKVPAGSLFICDGTKPVAIAGIMGGLNSEINDDTKNVLIESAYFEPVGIRKTSKLLNLQTDSSYRFERGIDPNITYAAAHRCATIIRDIAGGKIQAKYVDVHPVKTEPRKVTLRLKRLNKLLGTSFMINQAVSVLRALEFEVKKSSSDEMICTVPTFRPDVTDEIDLIEEVARIYDYNKIPNPDYIHIPRPEVLPFREQFLTRLREVARSLDFREIYANSLLHENTATAFAQDTDLIKTLNPISKDTAVLRPSLIPGLLKAAGYNFNRGAKSVRFFEIGNTFKKGNPGTWHNGIIEETWMMLGLGGLRREEFWFHKEEPYTIFDLRSAVEVLLGSIHLNKNIVTKKISDHELGLYYENKFIGSIAEVEKKTRDYFDVSAPLFVATLCVSDMLELAKNLPPMVYKPVPKFPGIDFDLALQVSSNIDAGDLEQTIRSVAGSRLTSISTFDVFEGKSLGSGQKSIAFRLIFIDEMKTLTIKDVDSIITKVVRKLSDSYGAKLRS
ncbi:MAG: phenylalanine--tRNA ligase subunit beta [Balneolales bacterium]|nr:phenylalanine--tRNA ligase subunit beta [Balneolales bacterium]